MKSAVRWALPIGLGLFVSCATVHGDGKLDKKGRSNWLIWAIKPVAPARVDAVYDHTIYKNYRVRGDCQPDCPKVDDWQYHYRSNGTDIVSTRPIASQKAYWRTPKEARIIAFSLFGKARYYETLLGVLQSYSHVKTVNGIEDAVWGYETFIPRIYVPKRNPKRAHLGPLAGEIPQEHIDHLLSLGCEVVFVDNGLAEVGLDATFWRFLVASEEMPLGQSIRYLVRDADWILTGAEAYAIGEWIDSGLQYHRNHQVAACLGPLTITTWGGSHQGKGQLSHLKTMIEASPYRLHYGDDEMFTRDVVWPVMKHSGSILTHTNERGIITWLGNPYNGSCEEPTQRYCDHMKKGGTCEDRTMPLGLRFPYWELAKRTHFDVLKTQHPEYFLLPLDNERGARVKNALSAQFE